jgi:two-component system phosphate regulon response regulator PhoB
MSGEDRMRILVVEDTEPVQKLIQHCLSKQYDVTATSTLGEARTALDSSEFDLIVLDVMLPDGSGFDFCSELQKKGMTDQVPIIFLTARGTPQERVQGLSLGAEDYVVKPFDPDELLARVETRLRRFAVQAKPKEEVKVGDLTFKLTLQRIILERDGAESEIDVTPLEFKLLFLLASRSGEILSREALIAEIWGKNIHILDRTIDSHLSKVRKKIGDSGYTVRSVHKEGYRFEEKERAGKVA